MSVSPRFSLFAATTAALVFTGCAQYAVVSDTRPRFTPIHSTVATLVTVNNGILKTLAHPGKDAAAEVGEYLTIAQLAAQELKDHPGDLDARRAYNFAISRIFSVIKRANLDPWTKPLRIPAPGGDFILTHRPDPRPQYNPSLYDFTPADQFDVKGTYVTMRTRKAGVGAPLVVVSKELRKDAAEMFAEERTYYGITALLRFEPGRRVEMVFADPLTQETVSFDGHSVPLAADFTVPLAVALARENPKKLELSRALRPDNYQARVVRLQPYDPNKTVVLVTHGLVDSPATWAPMLNQLRGDPIIRQHYQFWFYSYPSGFPYPYSAALLRHQLDAIEAKFPLHHKMVLIGHSMGSLISRLMITDTGDKLWLKTFGKPPATTPLPPDAKKLFEDALIFRHRSEVGRVIFISGPHRGSEMATSWFGRFASGLIRAPIKILKLAPETLKLVAVGNSDKTTLRLKGLPNSVDTLAPNNRFVKNINTIPITPGTPYHSIMGDRGKGGNKDHTPPVSTDGIVPYWSSHLEGAQSERIVPSNHSAHQNQQAIDEVRRILREHAGV